MLLSGNVLRDFGRHRNISGGKWDIIACSKDEGAVRRIVSNDLPKQDSYQYANERENAAMDSSASHLPRIVGGFPRREKFVRAEVRAP